MNTNISQNLDFGSKATKLWSFNYVNTLIASLVIGIANIILVTVLPLYTISIGGNNVIAGLLTTLLTLSAVICRPVFGKMLDSKGRKIVLILGLCLFSLSTILLVASKNMFSVLALRFLQGIGLSAYSTALGTIISDVVPASRVSEGVGYFGISGTLSMSIGPTLGLYLCSQFGYQTTYIITFGIASVSIVFASIINYEKRIKSRNADEDQVVISATRVMAATPQDQHEKGLKGFIEKSSIRPCLVLIFIVFAISAVFSFMPIFSKERNIENIGLFFMFYAVSMILSRLVTGKFADRYGYSKVFLPGIAITFLLFITLAFSYSLSGVLLAAVFYGVGYGTVQPIMNAIIITLSPPERRGAANATYYATLDIGFGLGSLVWGFVSQTAGFTAVFLGCALCIVLSVLTYFLILHPKLSENRRKTVTGVAQNL